MTGSRARRHSPTTSLFSTQMAFAVGTGAVCCHLKNVGRIAFFTFSPGYQPPPAKVATHPLETLCHGGMRAQIDQSPVGVFFRSRRATALEIVACRTAVPTFTTPRKREHKARFLDEARVTALLDHPWKCSLCVSGLRYAGKRCAWRFPRERYTRYGRSRLQCSGDPPFRRRLANGEGCLSKQQTRVGHLRVRSVVTTDRVHELMPGESIRCSEPALSSVPASQ